MFDSLPRSFDLTYRIRPDAPRAHLFRVEILIARPPDGRLTLSMPAWIPGSYLIRDFARNLLGVTARTADGQPLALEKLDKQTWFCEDVTGAVTVAYQVFAWELSVRAAHLDTTHAYFNGASLLLRVHGLEDRPCRVELAPPDDADCRDWRVATSLCPLDATPPGFGVYRADDYADLIDHPVEMGCFRQLSFTVGEVPHRIAISGHGQFDESRLLRDLTRICAQQSAPFGELPIDRYLFLLTVVGDGYGGLEHRFSTSLLCPRDDLPRQGEDQPSEGYQRLLGLCSHEYFHLWQVKRIRPQAFVDGVLDREVHTRQLWAFEGITSYYDELTLARSGCIDHKTYLGLLAATVTRVMRNPGRRVQTLAEASFDAWTKFYKPDENAPNALVSYYAKGALVALALDLTIRHGTDGVHSLDEVMRELWRRHGRTGIGVPERGVEDVASAVSGLDLDGFFAQALDSTEDIDLAALLATVGVGMRLRPSRGAKDTGGCVEGFDPIDPAPTLDVRLRPNGAEATIQHVISGGAGERAGLAPGDLLIAVDGLRATADNLDRLVARAAGQPGGVPLHLFRRDELMTLTADPQPASADTCELTLLDPVSDRVAQARAAWLASLA
ncbi:M61 family metallopeptidase [Thiocystis violascens]|uniref:Putative protease with the C-terminal PDZ domain n=1 Tax=Thiocystis violascens (strain ATCC 17096 / DSM 198 / 6111) TaxID=765911 RepID=I3Y6W9_THIV6|nr:PDZ domain-containing protein [Thiocystis violascens]AFL72737.1 putative protease with the C-terminal PDZ domain [Thiocystis violascens DSM 198]